MYRCTRIKYIVSSKSKNFKASFEIEISLKKLGLTLDGWDALSASEKRQYVEQKFIDMWNVDLVETIFEHEDVNEH